MFDTVLVANRGEIAVRIARTLRQMGIRAVGVYSGSDASSRHVREVDLAVRLHAAEGYLAAEEILRAAVETGAQAIHPGYGFLAENAEFARLCGQHGIIFVGPPPDAITAMGNKIYAKREVEAAGVPVVPGKSEHGLSDADIRAVVEGMGFPVLLKPSAGGGGKGMRVVQAHAELDEAIAASRREANAAFGDDTLLVERYVADPRHIEIQVLADQHDNFVHLGERECSLQRRHQKIIEESPSPLLDQDTRLRMGTAAVNALRAVNYTGAGTVEFIVSAREPETFFFMEANTRLQVEHPVTEMVAMLGQHNGIDLVEWQLRIAVGQCLPFTQSDIWMDGHSIEARIYAEDPQRGFLPTGGQIRLLREPKGAGIRVDSGCQPGDVIGSEYDPMLSKVIAWGASRDEAIRKLDGALAKTVILGVRTNLGLLRELLADVDVRSGELDTGLVQRMLNSATHREHIPEDVLVAAALARWRALRPAKVETPWDEPSGWRIGQPAWSSWYVTAMEAQRLEIRVRGAVGATEVMVPSSEMPEVATLEIDSQESDHELQLSFRGRTARFWCATAGEIVWISNGAEVWELRELQRLASRVEITAEAGPVVSPMPGTVLAVKVAVGDSVTAGQPLFVVEAMKMEHTVTSAIDGVVSEVHVQSRQKVRLEEPLAVVSGS